MDQANESDDNMSDNATNDLIDQLAAAIAKHMPAPIPLSVDLWGIKEISSYLKQTAQSVSERVVSLPGFPQAIRLPTQSGKKGHPRGKASEVIAWVEKHQEKRAA